MSESEILAELPRLRADERQHVFERLCELQEADLLNGIGATQSEKEILDCALAEFELDKNSGTPLREMIQRLRSPNKQ